jgi:hypothetical protein
MIVEFFPHRWHQLFGVLIVGIACSTFIQQSVADEEAVDYVGVMEKALYSSYTLVSASDPGTRNGLRRHETCPGVGRTWRTEPASIDLVILISSS